MSEWDAIVLGAALAPGILFILLLALMPWRKW